MQSVMPAKREQWFVTVRRQLKAEHGFGWSIRDHRGTVQLTRRFEDDSRSSAYLPLPWRKDSGTPILNWVTAIRNLMEQQNLPLKKAVKQYGDSAIPLLIQSKQPQPLALVRRHGRQPLKPLWRRKAAAGLTQLSGPLHGCKSSCKPLARLQSHATLKLL